MCVPGIQRVPIEAYSGKGILRASNRFVRCIGLVGDRQCLSDIPVSSNPGEQQFPDVRWINMNNPRRSRIGRVLVFVFAMATHAVFVNQAQGQEVEPQFRSMPLADVLKIESRETEYVKLSERYSGDLTLVFDSSKLKTDSLDNKFVYTHACLNDRGMGGEHEPRFTLGAKHIDPDTGSIVDENDDSHSTAYTTLIETLPSVESVSKYTTVQEFHDSFGRDRGWISGWGSDDIKHWSNSWLVFSPQSNGELAVMSVFAGFSISQGKTTVEYIRIKSGTFTQEPGR